MKQRGRSLGKTLLSATLAVIMVVEMLPWTAFAAFAANGAVKEEVVSALAEAYDGDEARAREELEALREVGIIDEDGNPVELDIQEDGVPVTLADVTARIGGGAETGNLTVNGHAATREQLMQIQSANAMMDVVRMMGEDVEITDEHVANFERLVQGIADGSVDIDAAIEQGSLSVDDIESAGENGADMEQASLFADDMESAALLTEDVGVTRQLNFASGEDPVVITCPKGVVSDETATMTIALKAAQSEAVKCVWEVGPGLWNGRSVRDTVSWSSGESDPKTVTFNVADVMEDIFDDDGNPFFDEDGNMEVPFSPDNPYITIHTYTYFGTSKQFSYHNMTTVLVAGSIITTGMVEADTDGIYVAPSINGTEYDESHSFQLPNPEKKTYKAPIETGGIVADGVVTLSCSLESFSYNSTEDTLRNLYLLSDYLLSEEPEELEEATVTVTATLNKPQALPVSFEYQALSTSIVVSGSGTVTWEPGEYGEKTFTFQICSTPQTDDDLFVSADTPTPVSNGLWDGKRAFALTAKNIKNATFSDGAYVYNKVFYAQHDFDIFHDAPPHQAILYNGNDPSAGNGDVEYFRVTDVFVPAGTYYSGQVIPITVTLSEYAKTTADTRLMVNLTECPPLDSEGLESNQHTFGYTVKDVDTGTLNVTDLTGLVNCGPNEPMTLDDEFPSVSYGIDEGMKLVSSVKRSSIDFDNIQYGISDDPEQVVTVLIPFREDGTTKWLVSEDAFCTTNGKEIIMPLPGYPDATAGFIIKSAYFSYDKGKTRYPVYVVTSGGEEGVALAARFAAPKNLTEFMRRDLINLFMDMEVGAFDADPYIDPWENAKTDSAGFAYFEGTGKDSAPIVLEGMYRYYVQPEASGATFDPEAYVSRGEADYAEKTANGYLNLDDNSHVLLQDAERPERRYDVEVIANDAFYQSAQKGLLSDAVSLDLTLSYQYSDRDQFAFTASKYFAWESSDPTVASIEKDVRGVGHIILTGNSGEVEFTLKVSNGDFESDAAYDLRAGKLTVAAGKNPFLSIPKYSQERHTLTDTDTQASFSSNVTARNALAGHDTTTYTAKLYNAQKTGDGYEKDGDAIWTADFTSSVENTLTHITVPGSELQTPGAYALEISAEFLGGTVDGVELEAKTLFASAYIIAKQAPAKVQLNKLSSYYVTINNIPEITYTVTPETAEVRCTVQSSNGSQSWEPPPGSGVIPPDSFFGLLDLRGRLKDSFTITVYARNSAEEAWSVDSMRLNVYNPDVLHTIVKEVIRGEIGGTTNGTGESVVGQTIDMDNHGKLGGYGVTDSNYTLTYDDFTLLRTDMSLQKIVSVNYGEAVYGMLSDKMQWESSDSHTVSVDYKQGGIYADIRNYDYTNYTPATDFLLVGRKDTEDGEAVTIHATHANTGMTADFDVTVKTLTNQLYLFQFRPKVTTDILYTNGNGVERTFQTNEEGQLAIYEESGIAGPVMAMSHLNGKTYVGTLFESDLKTGERDIASLQLYPCNNLRLREISNANLYFLTPSGQSYSGDIVIRGGAYKNGVYCPEAKIRVGDDGEEMNGREDIKVTVTNGYLALRLDPTQFKIDPQSSAEAGGARVGDKITYVFEYSFGDSTDYLPSYVTLNASTNTEGASSPAYLTVRLKKNPTGRNEVQLLKQTLERYYDGKLLSRASNEASYNGSLGISKRFNQAILYSDITLLGETVTTDDRGYSVYEGESVVGFALYTTYNKKLTGQRGGDITKADQIIELSTMRNSYLFVFPFSSIPITRNSYTINQSNLEQDGITDEGPNLNPTVSVKGMFTRNNVTVKTETMQFTITNLCHQKDPATDGAGVKEMGQEIRRDLQSKMDMGSIFGQIDVNDMLKKGFAFLNKISTANGKNAMRMIIVPSEDPRLFRIAVFIGAKKADDDEEEEGDFSINYDPDKLAEDMDDFQKEMDELQEAMEKDDDDDDDGGDDGDAGEVTVKANFYGTVILEARINQIGAPFSVTFCGGNAGTNFEIKYEWKQNFLCGPVPITISFEVGATADLEVSFANKNAAKALLVDASIGIYIKAFAGLGFDFSLVALKFGIEGKISAKDNFLYLTQGNQTGNKLDITGSIGLKFEVKVVLIKYSKTFCSTGFGWSKTWGNYDEIKQAWAANGFASLLGQTTGGRTYNMRLMSNGVAMVSVDGGGEIENRDYLSRVSLMNAMHMSAAAPSDGMTELKSNAYPYANPVLTDDGSMLLYISDNENPDELQSVICYAVKDGDGYTDRGRVDTSADNILADTDAVASGAGNHAFAAWVKQMESPEKEMHDEVNYDDLGMMLNATEIYVGAYNGEEWSVQRLTDNTVADMSPTVASNGNRAIVAWRSLNATSMPDEDSEQDITAVFNAENNINYRIYDGSEWKEAQIAYNGSAGTVNALDSAMLSNGASLLVYSVRTGDDVTSTETFYTVINPDGTVLITGRLTNDDYTDTNAQVTTVGDQFVLGWYSEHAADEDDVSGEKVVSHDIGLARIDSSGILDAAFPESIGGTSDSSIAPDFRFSAPVSNSDLSKLSIVWSQPKESDKPEDSGKRQLNAVRFFEENGIIGVTAQATIAETAKNYTIDHFDAYTNDNGEITAVLMGSDYSSIDGISVFDTIDLTDLPIQAVDDDGDVSDYLAILEQDPIASVKLASGAFPESAIEAIADTDLSELAPGLDLPVQFTVRNIGVNTVKRLNVQLGEYSEAFPVNILPGGSTVITVNYPVPETVSDVDYNLTADDSGETSGTLVINRPDVGIADMTVIRASDKTRDILVTLSNASEIPLTGSNKTVKLAFYRDGGHEELIGSTITIEPSAYQDIDNGIYTHMQTVSVEDFIDGEEVPEEGVPIYASAWVDDAEETYTLNNNSSVTLEGLLSKRRSQMTMDTALLTDDDGKYTIVADISNNSLQETNLGIIMADILDSELNILTSVALSEDDLTLTGEHTVRLSKAVPEFEGEAASVSLRSAKKSVILDARTNGGSSDAVTISLATDNTPAEMLPEATRSDYIFNGWYTQASGGEKVTTDTVLEGGATLYAQFTSTKSPASVKTAPTAKTELTYNGSAYALVNEGSAEGGAMYYAVSTEDAEPAADAFSTSVPTATNAGTYYVWYKVVGDDEHSDTDPACVTVIIEAKSISGATVTLDKTQTPYNGETRSVSVTSVTLDGETLTSSDYDVGGDTSGINPNAYTVTVTGKGNYKDTATANWRVTSNAMTATAPDVSAPYDKQPHGITVNVTEPVSGATVQYGTAEGAYTLDESPTITNVSDSPLTVYYQITAPNYETETGSATVTVTPKSVTVSGLTAEKVYDGTSAAELNADSASFDGIVSGDTLTVNGSAAFADANAGDGKTVNITGLSLGGASAGNYALSADTTTGTGKITKRPITITAANQTVELAGIISEGADKAAVSSGSLADGHSISAITLTASDTANVTTSGTIIPSAAKIASGGTDVTANYEITYANGVLTVSEGAPAVTAPMANALTYNGEAQTLTTTGSVTGGTMEYTLGSDASAAPASGYAATIPTGTNAGTYYVWYRVTGDSNHSDVAAACVTVTIGKGTPTVVAPTANTLTYDGTAKALVAAGSATGGALEYASDTDGTAAPASGWGTAIPTGTDAGTYYVWYRVTGGDNYNDIAASSVAATIGKKTVTVTANPQTVALNGTIDTAVSNAVLSGAADGHTLSAVTLTGSDTANATTSGTITPSAAKIFSGGTDVTENYEITYVNGVLTVSQGESGVIAPTAKNLTYSGAAQELVTAGTATGGAMQYALGTNANAAPTENYDTAIPTGTNAGTYYVWYKVAGDGSHSDTAPACVTVTVSKATITPSVSINGWTYGETANAPFVTGNSGNGAVTYSYKLKTAEDEAYDSAVPTAAGTYKVRAVIEETDNYSGKTVEAEFTIAQAVLTVTASGGSVTYGDAPKGFGVTYSGFVNSDTESVLSGAVSYSFDYAQYGNAGTYKITPSGLSAANYAITYADGKLTVNPKTVGLTWGDTAFSYDGTEKLPTATATGLVDGDTCTVTVTGGQMDVGENYTATASELSNANYVLPAENTVSFKITSGTQDGVTAQGWSGTYDGAAHGITVNAPSGATVTYSESESGTYATTNPTYTNAGTYTVYYKVARTGYNDVTDSQTVEITPKTVGLTWGDTAFSYDGTEKLPTATATGLVDGDTCTVTVTGGQMDVGENYTATASELSNANYVLPAENTVSFKITSGTQDGVTAQGWSGTYDGAAHGITVNAPSGAMVTYSETESGAYGAENPVYKDAGNYTVYYRVEKSGYDTVSGSATIAISKAALIPTLTFVDRSNPDTTRNSWPYKGKTGVPKLTMEREKKNASLLSKLVSLFTSDDNTVTDYGMTAYSYKERTAVEYLPYTAEELESLPVGQYVLRVEVAGSKNYNAVSVEANFSVVKAAHDNVETEPVKVLSGSTGLSVNLSAYLEEGAVCSVSGFSGMVSGSPAMDGNALLFDTGAGNSGTVRVTVSSRNYEDYAVTIQLVAATSFTLRFDSNGGDAVTETRTLRAGEAYGTLFVPTRTGYTFDGWHTAPENGTQVSATTAMTGIDTTLYARWTAVSYAVTLRLNGGALVDDTAGWTVSGDTATKQFQIDTPDFTLPEAVRTDNHSFIGWSATGEDAKLEVTISQGTGRNLTYNAQWMEGAVNGKVEFVRSDDSGNVMGIQDLEQDPDDIDAQRSSTEADGHRPTSLAQAMKEIAADIASANADEQDVTVTLQARTLPDLSETPDGNLSEQEQTVKREQTQIKAEMETLGVYNSAEQAKPDFLEINMEKTVSGGVGAEQISEASRVVEIPVRYNLTGRYNPLAFRFHNTASVLRRLASRPKDYRNLDGCFYVSGMGDDAVIYIYSNRFSTYSIVTSDAETYTVFFETDGGSQVDSQTVRANGTATKPANPVKDGYDFAGWRLQNSDAEFDFSTPITGDVRLYANWTAKASVTPSPSGGGSGGGSSSGSAKSYSVTVADAEHGSVKVSTNEATSGQRVTVTVTPESGYLTDSVTVKTAADKNVSVTKTVGGLFRFTMPANDVTVSAAFVKQDADSGDAGTKAASGNGDSTDAAPDNGNATVAAPDGGDTGTDSGATFGPLSPQETGVADWLITDTHPAYISGFSDGTFRPNANITRAQAAVMFYRLLKNPNVAITVSFTDMNGDEWYAEAVYALASLGVIQGYADGAFHGNDAISRAAFTAIAIRLAKETVPDDAERFSDVPAGHWARETIARASDYGWIGGYSDGTFHPAAPITRAAVTAIINRMLNRSADEEYVAEHYAELNRFSDVTDSNAWYYYNVMEASNAHGFAVSKGKERWSA